MQLKMTRWRWFPVAAGCVVFSCLTSPLDTDSAADKQTQQAPDSYGETVAETMAHLAGFDEFTFGEEDMASLRVMYTLFDELSKSSPDNAQAAFIASLTRVLLAVESPGVYNFLKAIELERSLLDPRLAGALPAACKAVVDVMATEPELTVQLQKTLVDSVLPSFDYAIERLPVVLVEPSFALEFPLKEETFRISEAEVAMFLGSVQALRALLSMTLCWDSNVSVDRLRLLQREDQIPGEQLESKLQIALKPEWRDRTAGIRQDLNDAIGNLERGLNAIHQVSDSAEGSLLRIGNIGEPGSVSVAQRDQALAALQESRRLMSGAIAVPLSSSGREISLDIFALFSVEENLVSYLPRMSVTARDGDGLPVTVAFHDATGNPTLLLSDVVMILSHVERYFSGLDEIVSQLEQAIAFPDPTFGGVFPGATNKDIWYMIMDSYLFTATGELRYVEDVEQFLLQIFDLDVRMQVASIAVS
jgi:hypothetical protein